MSIIRPMIRPIMRPMIRPVFRGGGFTPLSLFANGEQGAWYDPSDLTTLYQDAAGTIPVAADGDPVGYISDLSGNGKHATQSTSSARPLYSGLQYDGVDDYLIVPPGLASTQDVFLCGYASPLSFTGQQNFFELSRNDGISGVRILIFSNQWQFQAGNGARVSIASGSSESGVLSLILSSGVMVGRINGVEVGRVGVTGYLPNSGNSYIGASAQPLNFASGEIGSMLAVNRPVTQAEIELVEEYIGSKHGVAL